jgi:predicted DNA-binding transcriptional regulator AlpA
MTDIDDILGPRFAGRRFLRVNDLIELGLVNNRGTLDYWVRTGRFPAPIRVGQRCLLFAVAEIEDMLRSRAREREPARAAARPLHGEVSLMA